MVYTEVVESVSAQTLMTPIENLPHKGSIYYTVAFRGYRSLRRFGKHLVVNHAKEFVNKRTKNHIKGIEDFWCYAKKYSIQIPRCLEVPFYDVFKIN
jgi:transposase